MLADHWLLRLEYRYADFGQVNPTFFASNIGDNSDDRVYAHVWVKTHTVSLGAALQVLTADRHFGRCSAGAGRLRCRCHKDFGRFVPESRPSPRMH